MTMVVSPRSANRYGFKCSCCQLHKPKARYGKARDAERRSLKRKERAAVRRELASV